MLVLARKTGQSIWIGDACTITVRHATWDQARLLVKCDGKQVEYLMRLEDTISIAQGAATVQLCQLRRGYTKLGLSAPGLEILREEMKGDGNGRSSS